MERRSIHVDFGRCADELGNPLVRDAEQVSSISEWDTNLNELGRRSGGGTDRLRLSSSKPAACCNRPLYIFRDGSREAQNVRSMDLKRGRVGIKVQGDDRSRHSSGLTQVPGLSRKTQGRDSDHPAPSGGLPEHHSDPFDRMLIAQARTEGLTLITVDRRFPEYDVDLLPLD
jgi:hypothetical protein